MSRGSRRLSSAKRLTVAAVVTNLVRQVRESGRTLAGVSPDFVLSLARFNVKIVVAQMQAANEPVPSNYMNLWDNGEEMAEEFKRQWAAQVDLEGRIEALKAQGKWGN